MNKKIIIFSFLCLTIATLLPKSKVVSAATLWENIFKQDIDEDGTDEYTYRVYEGYVNDEYHFLYTNKDAQNIPGYNDITLESFGFSQDEYDRIENDYFEKDEAYWTICDQYGEESSQALTAYEELIEAENAYIEIDEFYYECQTLQKQALDELAESHGINVEGEINPNKTVKKSDKQKLYYFLHKPFNYDPNKSYPVLVFCPGSGGTRSSYFNSDGTYKKATVEPGDAGWTNSVFNSWYNAVRSSQENEEKYDCFIIYIYPNGNWTHSYYDSTLRENALCITNQYSYPKLNCVKLDGTITGDNKYKASYQSSYRASLTSPAPDSQLIVQLIDSLMKKYNIDPTRQYISGASYGGIFTMDTINHYPERFACAIPIVSPGADVSVENGKNLLNMNIWAMAGSSDTTSSKYLSKYFINAVNEARSLSAESTTGIAKYSIFSGGHIAGYFSSALRTAVDGANITYATETLDFMFNSKREDMDLKFIKEENKEINNIENDYLLSNLIDNKFDLSLISNLPLVDSEEYGFFVELVNNGVSKYKYIPVNNASLNISLKNNNQTITISSSSYNALNIYSFTIKDIPNTVTSIKFSSCIKTKNGYLYGNTNSYNLDYSNNNVRMVKR